MTRAVFALCASLVAQAGCVESPPPGEPPIAPTGDGGEWQARAPLPAPRQETAVVALDGEVYVIGGIDDFGRVVTTVSAYDPAADSWRAVADLPVPLHHAQAAAADGRLVVAGFLTSLLFSEDGRVYRYDPGDDLWSPGEPMPTNTERGAGVAVTVDDAVYVFGGLRGAAVTDVSRYRPADDSWEILPSLPESSDHLMAGVIDGIVYIAGGRLRSIGAHRASLWAFDPTTETFEARAPLPTSRAGGAAAVAAGRLVVVGGEGNPGEDHGVFPQAEAYDPMSDGWSSLTPMPTPRHGMGAAAVGDVVFVPGGADVQGFAAVAVHEALDPTAE